MLEAVPAAADPDTGQAMLFVELECYSTRPDSEANTGRQTGWGLGEKHPLPPTILHKRTLFSWTWRSVTPNHALTMKPALHLRGSGADQMSLVNAVDQHGLGWLEPPLHHDLLALTAHHGNADKTCQKNQADGPARGRSAKSICLTLLVAHLWVTDGPEGSGSEAIAHSAKSPTAHTPWYLPPWKYQTRKRLWLSMIPSWGNSNCRSRRPPATTGNSAPWPRSVRP
jgi:hypothetical protein